MISNAFKSAYTNQVSQQNQSINNITQGVKDLGTAIIGAMGFSGALGESALSEGSKHALTGRIGGIGGNIMLATLEERKQNAIENKKRESMFAKIDNIESTQGTVFEVLQRAKEQKLINEKGNFETSFGEVDPNSDLGKKITENLKEDNK